MTQITTFTPPNSSLQIQGICVNGDPWFRGKDVAMLLGYTDTKQAIRTHVEDDCKKKLEELGGVFDTSLDANAKNSIFINDVGLYSLTLSSQKPEAKAFRRWVTSEVLPSIRKTGSYVAPTAEPPPPPPPPPPPAISNIAARADYKENHSFNMQSENDLHGKVGRVPQKVPPPRKDGCWTWRVPENQCLEN